MWTLRYIARVFKQGRQQLKATMGTCSVIATEIYRSLQKQLLHCAGADKCETINSGNSGSK